MKWIGLAWCWLRGHKIKQHRCNCIRYKFCVTCYEGELDAAYDPNAYKIGDRLWPKLWSEEVVVERIERPTTLGSKAWLMTRLKGIPRYDENGRENGGTIGAPDTSFSKVPLHESSDKGGVKE